MSVINFTKLSFSLMKKNKFSRVINILTVLAKEPTSQMVLSSTIRSGVMAFSKAVSHEIGLFGITINNICPGGVLTNRFQTLLNERAKKLKISKKEFFKQRAATVPIGRFAKPEKLQISFYYVKMNLKLLQELLVADGGQNKLLKIKLLSNDNFAINKPFKKEIKPLKKNYKILKRYMMIINLIRKLYR